MVVDMPLHGFHGNIMAEGEIDNLTMEQYLALTRGNQAPGVRVLDIVSLFNIPGVTHDAVMLHVFPITLTGAAKRNVDSSSNSEGITAIVSKLDSLGRDMKKLKENIYVIQVGCQICGGAHLDKECPLNKEVKSVEEVKYGEFGRSSPFRNGAKYHVGPPGYYTRLTIASHLEKKAKLRGAYEQVAQEEGVPSRVLPCQLPPQELNPGCFTLPCTIRCLNFYAMADLGASVNVIPKSMFEHLKLARLKKTNMLVQMANMTKKALIGIVENFLVKINKFLFLSDFVVIDMLNTRNETMILGRPFLATIYVEIDVFDKEISLGIGDDRVTFNVDKKIHNFITPVGMVYMVNSIHNDEPSSSYNAPLDKSSQFEKSNNLHNENNYDNYMQERSRKKARMLKSDTNSLSVHFCKPVKQICNGILKVWPTCDPIMKVCNGGNEIYGMDEKGV
ncbi:reverse transcriptase domain-containing protein [Tanacetum coccineum]